jgi:glycoside hydrolase, family 3 domain-containing protein
MFDETEYDHIPYEVVECREHIELSIEAACKSVVLLKNDGILPLNKKKLKTIGVIGPNANSREALVGNYHGTASRYVTVLEGIQDYVGDDVRVLYSEGCHLFLDQVEKLAREDDRISEAMTVAEHSDLVILCLGLDESLEGEEGDTGNAYASGDKQGLMLPPSQQRLLEIVAEMGVPFIVCMMAGSAMDLNLADDRANAVLQTWYPGARGGKAVADILFGEISPSGKLPVTIYRNLQGMPDFDDYSMKNRTYRFVEKAPLYPFGYGLNYADTLVMRAELTEDVVYAQTEEQSVGVEVTVANHGDVFTEDVLQVYVQVEDINEVPNPKLAVFKRVELAPGEEKMVTLEIPMRAFTVVDEEGKFVHTGRGADIYVGFGQPDERTKELTGKKCLKIHI